jgi:hypothetical protein
MMPPTPPRRAAIPRRGLSCRISKWRCRPPSSQNSSCCATAKWLLLLSRRFTKTRRRTSPMMLMSITARLCVLPLEPAVAADSNLKSLDDEPLKIPTQGCRRRIALAVACRWQCAITVLAAEKKLRFSESRTEFPRPRCRGIGNFGVCFRLSRAASLL